VVQGPRSQSDHFQLSDPRKIRRLAHASESLLVDFYRASNIPKVRTLRCHFRSHESRARYSIWPFLSRKSNRIDPENVKIHAPHRPASPNSLFERPPTPLPRALACGAALAAIPELLSVSPPMLYWLDRVA
jgi:hypothetical protein